MQRSAFRAGLALVLVIVVGLVVFGAYQAGLVVGAGASGNTAAAAPPAMRYWALAWRGPFFFHPFGLLVGLFFLFLVFWFVRALLRGGRGWDGPGWREDRHQAWEDRRRDAFETWHREAHARGEAHATHDAPSNGGPADGGPGTAASA